jgi:hypothetical protein
MNQQDDFDKWCDQWDKALDDGVFEGAPKPPVSEPRADFFGQYNGPPDDDQVSSVDAQYWHDVYRAAIGGYDMDDPNNDFADGNEGLMSEDHKAIDKAAADALAHSHNPIDPTTVGKDQDIDVDGNEQEVKDIEELSEMKVRLEKLESRLNANYTENKSITGVQKQIDTLRNQIDELSDTLNGFRFQPSQP